MLTHYLKVGVRNLLAHKTQTLVSLFGLAIAFACVSLATYWNHYERTYDAFQKDADRIYQVRKTNDDSSELTKGRTPGILHLYLKERYPEIELACAINRQASNDEWQNDLHYAESGSKVSMNGITYPERVFREQITEDALDIFDFEWIKGNENVMSYKRSEVAISDELARGLCGNQSPLGQKLEMLVFNDSYRAEFEVVGVFKARSRHSNLKFEIINPYPSERINDSWGGAIGFQTYIKLKPGVDFQRFIKKMQTDTLRGRWGSVVFGDVTPLKALRYTYPENEINISLEDVGLFSYAAILLTLCALLNYLILFVSRLRTRGRDMALRAICGSSGWQMTGLLLTEYLLLLFGSSLLGMLFVELVMQKFMELAMIQIEFSSVLVSCGYLMLFSIVLSILLSTVPILYFKRKTLRIQIEAIPTHLGKNYFRSVGVCVQLIIGFLFIFCTTVMMKQVYMLTNVDSIERKQVAWASADQTQTELVQDVLRQQPFIRDFIITPTPLYPSNPHTNNRLCEWEGKSTETEDFMFAVYDMNDEIAQFYGLKMKEGPLSFDLGKEEVFINEAFAQKMNVSNPIGQTILPVNVQKGLKIKGIICDYQTQNPNSHPIPIMYFPFRTWYPVNFIAFKYDGDWEACHKKLEKELKDKNIQRLSFADGEKYYQYFLKSEYNLLKLLGVITIVSILIAIFGIYALIMQSCDQHQKEIAVRKVFGAQVVDILLMFFKQYMMQVVVAAVIAFPIGYFLMKNWLQQYARQTAISFWIYLAIFVGISLLVTLCIGWRVWKAANENPAAVIKKE